MINHRENNLKIIYCYFVSVYYAYISKVHLMKVHAQKTKVIAHIKEKWL